MKMAQLNNFIAPPGSNLKLDIWVLAGPWVQIGNASLQFADMFTLNSDLSFAYLTHNGKIRVNVALTDRNPSAGDGPASVDVTGTVDGKPVNMQDTSAKYHVDKNKLVIVSSKVQSPATFFKYHGHEETEVDTVAPTIGNVSLWIGK